MAKKKKVFVDSKDTALSLAESIAVIQEQKTSIRQKHSSEKKEPREKPRKKEASRLERAKEIVLSRKAEAKRAKASKRREAVAPHSKSPIPKKKKGVSFA